MDTPLGRREISNYGVGRREIREIGGLGEIRLGLREIRDTAAGGCRKAPEMKHFHCITDFVLLLRRKSTHSGTQSRIYIIG